MVGMGLKRDFDLAEGTTHGESLVVGVLS